MKRAVTLFTALAAFAVGSFASTAQAGGHEWHEEEHGKPHGHVMLIGVEVKEGFASFKRCVEFKALPVPAHHNSIHTGSKAGGSPFVQGALFKAGNWVIPLAPITPFTGCESFTSPFPLP